MEIVYLGHQTLLAESGGVKILIDPVFRARMAAEKVVMYPPKVIDDAGLFPVHGVVITHTHLDHVDCEAFARINKDAVVFVSCHSYGRLAPLIAEHGFDPGKIIPLQAGTQVRLGKIRIGGARFARPTDEQGLGEPDVTPIVLHDGTSGLLNFVDIFPHSPSVVAEVEATFGPLTCLVTAWNYTRGRTDILSGPLDREAELASSAESLAGLFAELAVPNVLVVGNGFVLDDQFAPFNRHLFPVAKHDLCARASREAVAFHALEVGRSCRLDGPRLTPGEPVPWVALAPPDDRQRYDPTAVVPKSYTPFLGSVDLDEAERDELETFLEEEYTRYLKYRYLTQFFFTGLVYQGAYHEGLALWLEAPGGAFGYRFVRGPDKVEMLPVRSKSEVRAAHVWVELTARDLLGLVRGEIVLIDPVYYDQGCHPEFLAAIVAPTHALFREPMGIFDPFYHGRAVERAVLGT